MTVALAGGATSTLCKLDGQSRGATWGEDGQVIFATGNAATGLQRVAATGGMPEVLTTPDASKGEGDHLWPQVLPGAGAVLFTMVPAQGGADLGQIWTLDLRTRTRKLILIGGSQASTFRAVTWSTRELAACMRSASTSRVLRRSVSRTWRLMVSRHCRLAPPNSTSAGTVR